MSSFTHTLAQPSRAARPLQASLPCCRSLPGPVLPCPTLSRRHFEPRHSLPSPRLHLPLACHQATHTPLHLTTTAPELAVTTIACALDASGKGTSHHLTSNHQILHQRCPYIYRASPHCHRISLSWFFIPSPVPLLFFPQKPRTTITTGTLPHYSIAASTNGHWNALSTSKSESFFFKPLAKHGPGITYPPFGALLAPAWSAVSPPKQSIGLPSSRFHPQPSTCCRLAPLILSTVIVYHLDSPSLCLPTPTTTDTPALPVSFAKANLPALERLYQPHA